MLLAVALSWPYHSLPLSLTFLCLVSLLRCCFVSPGLMPLPLTICLTFFLLFFLFAALLFRPLLMSTQLFLMYYFTFDHRLGLPYVVTAQKNPLYLSFSVSSRDFLSSASFREVAIEVSACYLKRRAKKQGCLQCPQNTGCLETGSTIAPKRSSTQRQPTCSHFLLLLLLLLMAEQRLQQNNPHAYQRIMHPSPPLPILLNGAHTQQAFHPTTMSYLAFSHSLVPTATPPSL